MKILGIIGMILFLYQQLKLQIASKKENQLETDIEKNTLAHQQQIIELCIDLLKPNGKVLQFGFSHGFSGNKILNYNIKDLLIIEPNKYVYNKAKKWSNNLDKVTLKNKTLEESLSNLKCYDTVFIDCFNINNEENNNAITKLINEKKISLITESLIINSTTKNGRIVLLLSNFQNLSINSELLSHVELRNHDLREFINFEADQESLLKILSINKI
tara:strand:+ start:884 stop:1531 length:648 start_codon:yes stop_codon:yes gene_type:complete